MIPTSRTNRNAAISGDGTEFDLDPHQPLGGRSLIGTVARRFLITYAVDPGRLANHVPAGAELSLADGRAWVSACFVHIADMRLAGMPSAFGVPFDYLIHRTRVRLRFPDGVMRESVLVLDPSIGSRSLARLGRLATGVRFRAHDISLDETSDGWRLHMADGDRTLLDVSIDGALGSRLPAGSCFTDGWGADAYLLGVAYGGEWQPDRERIRLLAETHGPWTTRFGTARTHTNAFLESLGISDPVADHVITMTDVPHHFALRGVDVAVPTAGAGVRG